MKLILLLGSYDPETIAMMKRLQEFIAKTFGHDEIYTLILERLELYQTDKVDVLAEKWSDEKVTLMMFDRKPSLVDVTDVEISEGLNNTVENFLKENYQVTTIHRIPILEKLSMLARVCWLIFVIRHLELTRGGELVELTYLAPSCNGKIFLLKREGVLLSTMVKEILDAFDVNLRTYNDENELMEEVERIILNKKLRERQ